MNASAEPLTYEVIIDWSAGDRAFVAEVPELAGCAADGETDEAALQAAQIVMREWVETAQDLGREIPAPRGRLQFA